MKYILFIIAAFTFTNLNAQDKKAYQLFDKKGKKVTFDKVIKETLKTEVVLFGEFHDNPICHWLQLELTKEVVEPAKKKRERFSVDKNTEELLKTSTDDTCPK